MSTSPPPTSAATATRPPSTLAPVLARLATVDPVADPEVDAVAWSVAVTLAVAEAWLPTPLEVALRVHWA